jgi:hypothetical protein
VVRANSQRREVTPTSAAGYAKTHTHCDDDASHLAGIPDMGRRCPLSLNGWSRDGARVHGTVSTETT